MRVRAEGTCAAARQRAGAAGAGSPTGLLLEPRVESVPEVAHDFARGAERGEPRRRHGIEPAWKPVARFRARNGLPSQQAFVLEPVERRVERPARDAPSGTALQLAPDRRSVGLVAEPDDDQEDLLFEFTE